MYKFNPFTGNLDLIENTKYVSSSGVVSGGIISIGTPTSTFSITDGTGIVVDNTTQAITPVSWTGLTNQVVTNLATQDVTYLAIDINGILVQQNTPFTEHQHRDNIVLGVLGHLNHTNIEGVNQTQNVVHNPLSQLSDLEYSIGIFNVSGNIFSANGINLNINKTSGVVHKRGSNWATDTKAPNTSALSAQTPATFEYVFQNGIVSSNTTLINPNIYDVGGVSTSVPNNKFTIQRIFVLVGDFIRIQPGQNVYNSLSDAKAAIQTEVFVTDTSLLNNALLRSFLIVKQGTTDLTDSTATFFLEAPKFGGSAGVGGLSTTTLQGAYNNSVTPEITTDSILGALTVKRGSTADTDNVIEVQNGAGTVTAQITGAGAITGTNLSGTNTGDQVFEYATSASFPVTGTAGQIYVDKSNNLIYRWSGTAYVELSPSGAGLTLGRVIAVINNTQFI